MKAIFKKVYQIACYVTLAIFIFSFTGNLIVISDKFASLSVLMLAMIIGEKPLYNLMKKYNFYPVICKLLRYNNQQQRYQGLITVNLLLTHSVCEIIKVGLLSAATISNLVSVSAALILFAFLLITSSRFIQRHFKGWKRGQKISWAISPSIVLHVLFVKQELGIGFVLFVGSIALIIIEKVLLHSSKWKEHRKYLIFGIILAAIQAVIMANIQ